jgi:hypothetical protein
MGADPGTADWWLTLGPGSRGSGLRWGDDDGVRLSALRACAEHLAVIIEEAERALPRPVRPLLAFDGGRAVLTIERPSEGLETPEKTIANDRRPRY